MKVLEKRDPNTRRKRCDNCKSLLEYSKKDISIIEYRDISYSFGLIMCPICNRNTRLEKKEII